VALFQKDLEHQMVCLETRMEEKLQKEWREGEQLKEEMEAQKFKSRHAWRLLLAFLSTLAMLIGPLSGELIF